MQSLNGWVPRMKLQPETVGLRARTSQAFVRVTRLGLWILGYWAKKLPGVRLSTARHETGEKWDAL